MKKQEAIDLIKTEQAKGTDKEEIVEILMSQDKIGNTNPTREFVESLFAAEPDDDEDEIRPKTKTMKKQEVDGIGVYEKWKYDDKTHEPIKKLKAVRMSDQMAEMLNRANSFGHGYVVKYIKK